MNVALYLVLIVLFSTVLGVSIGVFSEPAPKGIICNKNPGCLWKITNCCPESAGAMWECVNIKTFEEPECPTMVICPQVIAPKPERNCVCEDGNCVVE